MHKYLPKSNFLLKKAQVPWQELSRAAVEEIWMKTKRVRANIEHIVRRSNIVTLYTQSHKCKELKIQSYFILKY
jgi:hypothetical protein